MATRGRALWLPKSKAIVCLPPTRELTDMEADMLDEYVTTMLAVQEKSDEAQQG